MKKFILCVCLCALIFGGCSGVIMSAEYSKLTDETAATANEAAARAKAGTLPPDVANGFVIEFAKRWQRIKDAKDGKAGE